MTLAPKPKNRATEADIDAVIGRGMAAQEAATPAPEKDLVFTMRVPAKIAGPMKAAIEARTVRVNRQAWIQEAIAEKIARELGNADPAR